MPEYLFDVKLFAAVRVQADDEPAARKMLDAELNCASCNAGAWPNGDAILFEASADGEADLVEIDGEPVADRLCDDCWSAPPTQIVGDTNLCDDCMAARTAEGGV